MTRGDTKVYDSCKSNFCDYGILINPVTNRTTFKL